MTLPLTPQRVESSTQLSLEYGRLMVPCAAQAAALMSNSSRTRHVAQQGTKPMITPWAHLEGGEAVASPCSVAQWEETSGCQLCTTAGAGDEGWLCEQTCGSLQYQTMALGSCCTGEMASTEKGNTQVSSEQLAR